MSSIRSYDGQVNPYVDLGLARLDAVLMDTPIALYYANSPAVKNIELPSARMSFGIGVSKTQGQLLEKINAALDSLRKDGTLRKIYTDWGIYNAATAQAFGDQAPISSDAPRYREFLESTRTQRSLSERLGQYWKYMPLLLASRARHHRNFGCRNGNRNRNGFVHGSVESVWTAAYLMARCRFY